MTKPSARRTSQAPRFGVAFALTLCGAGLAHAAGPLAEESTREFTQAIPLASGQTLEINHSQGNVEVASHSGRDAMIRATIRVSAESLSEAKQFADDVSIRVNSSSIGAMVSTEYPNRTRSSGWLDFIWGRNTPSFAVDYTILVPAGVLVSVRNRYGAVRLTGIDARTTVVNANGRVVARGLGPGARLQTSFGSMEVSQTRGELTLENSNGSVTLLDADGPVSITDRFGRVSAGNVSGALSIVNSNGSIDVRNAKSTVTARSSFAGIALDEIGGNVTIHNENGSIAARGLRAGGRLETSFAPVSIADAASAISVVAKNARITINGVSGSVSARTSFAPVDIRDSTGPVDVEATNSSVSITGIGGAVRARTSFGSLVVSGAKGTLTAQNANGAVRATGIAGNASIHTTFGPVTLSDVTGSVQIENENGSVDAALGAGVPCGANSVTSSFGSIRLALPETVGYKLTARTTFGRVMSTNVPITYTGTMSGTAVSGTIGAGGCPLTIINSNGNITLDRAVR